MRELNHQEVTVISGGNFSTIGSTLGGVADSVTSILGLTTDFSSQAGQIGTGIGQLFSLSFVEGSSNIIAGVTNLVNTIVGLASSSGSESAS